jgi:hypothetical protein
MSLDPERQANGRALVERIHTARERLMAAMEEYEAACARAHEQHAAPALHELETAVEELRGWSTEALDSIWGVYYGEHDTDQRAVHMDRIRELTKVVGDLKVDEATLRVPEESIALIAELVK